MLYKYFFKSTFWNKKYFVIYFVVSITVSLFCINSTYGIIQEEYNSSYSSTRYATIGIIKEHEKLTEDYKKYLEKQYMLSVGSAVYITRIDKDTLVIGWAGNDLISYWLPHAGGRFFDENELKKDSNLIYISYEEYSYLADKSNITLDDMNFDIIGYGWITEANFFSIFGMEIANRFYSEDYKNGFHMGKPEEYKKFRIIPYKTYVNMGYSPELVLLHLQDQKFHNMNEIVEKMKTDLSYATVALPDQNSEKLYFRLITGYLPICIILALIVLVSSISVLYILIDAVRVHIHVFLICGISRKRMLWYLFSSLLLLFCVSDCIAIAIQAISVDLLKIFGASSLPEIRDILIAFFVLFLVVLPFGMKGFLNATRLKRSVL